MLYISLKWDDRQTQVTITKYSSYDRIQKMIKTSLGTVTHYGSCMGMGSVQFPHTEVGYEFGTITSYGSCMWAQNSFFKGELDMGLIGTISSIKQKLGMG